MIIPINDCFIVEAEEYKVPIGHDPKLMDSIKELVDSIKANGMLRPILVEKVETRYKVEVGSLRLRACLALGHTHIEAEILT